MLIILLFSGQVQFKEFEYQPSDFDGTKGFTDTEIVLSCSEEAERQYDLLGAHSWDDPRGQSWYLFDGTGTIQGHIC